MMKLIFRQSAVTYPVEAVPPPPPKVKPPPAGVDVVLAAAPNLNPPPPGVTAKAALALPGLSKAEEGAFLAVDPGLGVSQQTQDSLSASFGTMHALKVTLRTAWQDNQSFVLILQII